MEKKINLQVVCIIHLLLIAVAFCDEQMPEFVLQNGHSSTVTTLSCSPDGKTLSSGSYDNTIKIWDIHTGKLLRTIVAFNPENVFNTSEAFVSFLSYSPDSKVIAAVGAGNIIKFWDARSGKLLRTLICYSHGINSFSYSPDGKFLATGGADSTENSDKDGFKKEFSYTIKIWNISSGRLLQTLKGHWTWITSLSYSPDGKILASVSEFNVVKVWNTATGAELHSIKGHVGNYPLSYSPDGKMIATGSKDTIKVWNSGTGEQLRTIIGHSGDVACLSYSPDGKKLSSGSEDSTVKIWDVNSGTLLQTLSGHLDEINSLSYSPDGKMIASGSGDKTIKIWDTETGKLLRNFSKNHSATVVSLRLSPDGRTLAFRSGSKTVIWEVGMGKLLRTFTNSNYSHFYDAFSYSPDGNTLASGCNDSTVKIWDFGTGKLLRTLKGFNYYITSLSYSPDGKSLISGSLDKKVRIYDVLSGKLLYTRKHSSWLYEFAPVNSVSFSPNGSTFASGGSDCTVKIWKAGRSKRLHTLKGHNQTITSLSYSPDGKLLASGSWDKTIKIWDVGKGKLLHTLSGHTGRIFSLSYSPDGRTLASGGEDNTVKIWNPVTGNLLHTLSGHSEEITSLIYSLDGKLLISGSIDCSIKYWNVMDGKLLITSYVFDNQDYLSFTSIGYYSCSPDAAQYAAWRIGNSVYGFERYADHFNSPEYIRKLLALDGNIIGTNDPIAKTEIHLERDLPPDLVWLNRDTLSSCNESQITLICQYTGQKPWNDIFCLHNYQPVRIPTLPEEKDSVIFKIPLTLTTAENTIIINASDTKKLKSNSITAAIVCEKDKLSIHPIAEAGRKGPTDIRTGIPVNEPVLGDYGKKYAIIIGVSDYKALPTESTPETELCDLKYCHNDAVKFETFLKDTTKSGGNWDIICLVNELATSTAVDDALTGILTKANPQDLIFIFFSGHGRSHPSKPEDVYLLTYDFDPRNYRSGFPYAVLRDLIRESRAEHIVAFLDACKTGIVGYKGEGGKGDFDQDAFGKKIRQMPANKVIITSGKGSQVSWEDKKLEQGVFTHFLIRGLNGEAPEHNNSLFVDLGELSTYLSENVENYTKKNKKLRPQKPQVFEARGMPQEDFPVAIRRK